MPECHTLIISDVHLGSKVCRSEKLLNLLHVAKFKVLVINGDLFDGNTTHKLSPLHWEILSTIADIARTREVLLVGGNHGRKLDAFVRKMGIGLKDAYSFSMGHEQFLCLHGDQFDVFTQRMPRMSNFFTALYEFIQRFGGSTQSISMFLKRFSKTILHVQARQQRLALAHAAKHQASVMICSHTHFPYRDRRDGILFVNTGSFCDNPCSYITISKSGNAQLCEV